MTAPRTTPAAEPGEARFVVGDGGGKPKLQPTSEPAAEGAPDAPGAPSADGLAPQLPALEPWTPEEAAGFAAGAVSIFTGLYSLWRGIPPSVWEAHLRGDPREFAASAPALARRFEEYFPRSMGGAPGMLADGMIVGQDFLSVAVRRRQIIVQWNQHKAQEAAGLAPSASAQRETQRQAHAAAPARQPADEGGGYRLPDDLAAAVGPPPTSQSTNGLTEMGYA